jgi:hypothetical protein
MAMIARFFAAIAAGLLVGNILAEASRNGLALLAPDYFEAGLWLGPPLPGSLTLLLLMATWLLAGTSSAAMATAIAQSPLAGWLCGIAWSLAIVLTGGLAGTSVTIVLTALGSTLTATLLGNRIAQVSAREQSTLDADRTG